MDDFPKMMPCWLVSWPDDDYGEMNIYVWADTRGEAKAWANATEYTDYAEFTDLRASKQPWGDRMVGSKEELVKLNNGDYANSDDFIRLALENGHSFGVDDGCSMEYFEKDDIPMIDFYGGYGNLIGKLVDGVTREELQEKFEKAVDKIN